MAWPPKPLDLSRLQVFPLEQRESLTRADDILIDPNSAPPTLTPENEARLKQAAEAVRRAKAKGGSVILMYGAHLLRNGAALIVDELMRRGWVTHLATNGAGSIHDWEYAWLGRSTESVEKNVARGCFGTWDETGRNILVALHAGALDGHGYGYSLGKLISEDGATIPAAATLEALLKSEPSHPLASARADLLKAIRNGLVAEGRHTVVHRWKQASVFAHAYRNQIPLTVHPGIGYDIIVTHPIFDGGVVGRAAGTDYGVFCSAVENLDNGVVLSVGSAIMAPQVFEKSLSCVHNLRFQTNRPAVTGHSIFVVDLQDGGGWDWSRGEPPKSNPAYYLRFCKSFSRMGGTMQYLCCDNLAFVHHLLHLLRS